jgi:hypothetical protein
MFHVELRQFPHNACAFNLSEQELVDRILAPWARGEVVALGERKWSPHRARLTVLEGPRLSMSDLSMGRGWRNAEHGGRDVTDAALDRARSKAPAGRAAGGSPLPSAAQATPATAVDAAGALRPLLGEDPDALLTAWRLAAERRPELSPSEALALAERTLGALDAGPS